MRGVEQPGDVERPGEIDVRLLRAEQLRLAFRNVPQGVLGSLAILLTVIVVLSGESDGAWLAIWSAFVLGGAGWRMRETRLFQEAAPGTEGLGSWLPRFHRGLILTGLVWGAAGIVLFPAQDAAGQVFLAFVLGGMATGAVGTYSSLPGASPLFIPLVLLPITIRFLLTGREIDVAMGLLLIVYGGILYQLHYGIHRALAHSLSLQLENRDLLQELAASRAAEEQTASRIQQVLLFGSVPTGLEGVSMGALVVSSKAVGGDFYDFYRISDSVLDILVGDVMGKGVPAALIGAGTKSRFQQAFAFHRTTGGEDKVPQPAEIVEYVRSRLTGRLIELESFVTLFYARLDLRDRGLVYVNCGHLPPLRITRGNGRGELLTEAGHAPLGFDLPETMGQHWMGLEDGDVLIFYSDGITEARNAQGEQFGIDRLKEAVGRLAAEPPGRIAERVREEVTGFVGGDVLQDDITCLVIAIGTGVEGGELVKASLETASAFSELASIRRFVEDFCVRALRPPLDPDSTRNLMLAANEAAANIMKHAYEGRENERIRLLAEANSERVELTLVHSGLGLESMPTHVSAPDEMEEKGRGLYLIRKSVDGVEYMPWGEGESCIRLAKKR